MGVSQVRFAAVGARSLTAVDDEIDNADRFVRWLVVDEGDLERCHDGAK